MILWVFLIQKILGNFLRKITCTIIYVLYERWQTIIDIENNHEFLETKILKKRQFIKFAKRIRFN